MPWSPAPLRIAKHHALVACAFAINAQGDIAGLLRNMDRQIKGVSDLRLPDSQYLPYQVMHIRLMVGGDFPGNRHVVVFDQGFDSHTGLEIMTQAVRQYCVRNLVTDFVRVSSGHLFRCKKHSVPPSGKRKTRQVLCLTGLHDFP